MLVGRFARVGFGGRSDRGNRGLRRARPCQSQLRRPETAQYGHVRSPWTPVRLQDLRDALVHEYLDRPAWIWCGGVVASDGTVAWYRYDARAAGAACQRARLGQRSRPTLRRSRYRQHATGSPRQPRTAVGVRPTGAGLVGPPDPADRDQQK